ncbi:hypothetical protein [Streptomyces lydicus]|uniref:hypothetical protein n=1 Tax=Streptomyces lydicus TaxID=47763 RepID=UPI0036EC8244
MAHAHLLVGSLAHSGRWWVALEDFPPLVQALDDVVRKYRLRGHQNQADAMRTAVNAHVS